MFESTKTTKSKSPPKQSYKGVANVKESRLNARGDQNWRGSRGGEKTTVTKGKAY